MRILRYILDRLKENSTRVIVVGAILGVIGVSLSPEQTESIVGLVAAIVAALVAFLPEKTVTPPTP